MKRQFCSLVLGMFSALSLTGANLYVDGKSQAADEKGTQAAPYKTISKAMRNAKHGDDVIVADGTYRERIFVYKKRGDKVLNLKAAPGARPVLSGFQHVTEWTKDANGLYTTTLDFKPRLLLINGQFQQLARYPEVGWLKKTQTGKDTFTAPIDRKIPAGAGCYIWYSWFNVFGELKLKDSPKPGSFVLEPNKARLSETTDLVYFRNHPGLIAKNGQWAWKQLEKRKFQVYVRCDTPIEKNTIEIAGKHIPLMLRDSNNINVTGFNVMGSEGPGIQTAGCENIHLSKIGSFWNSCGIYFRFCKNVSIEDSRISANQSGFSASNNEGITYRKCDVGFNAEDGVRITWKSKNGLVEGCRLHHQLWRGHPDNAQFYRTVNDVTIKDNLFFCGFQGIMAEQVRNFNVENNIIVGIGGVGVIWGHNSCFNILMKQNTVLFGGWGSVVVSGKGFNFTENILSSNEFHRHPITRHDYKGTKNHFITNGDTWFGKQNNLFFRTYDTYIRISGEKDYTRQKFPVKGMPVSMARIDNLGEATTTSFSLGKPSYKDFKVGDYVEVCFDGVPRKITAVDEQKITITPALKYPPSHQYPVFNWKTQKDLVWKPQFTTDRGSKLSWDDIRLDRCTTVPMPANVKYYTENIDALLVW